jgi:hypothetical protein
MAAVGLTVIGSVMSMCFLCGTDLVGMVSSQTSGLAAVSHDHISSRLFIQVLLVATDRTSARTTANRTTTSTTLSSSSSNRISITVSVFCQLYKGSLVFGLDKRSPIQMVLCFVVQFLLKNFGVCFVCGININCSLWTISLLGQSARTK